MSGKRRKGVVRTPPDSAMAPCLPSCPGKQCEDCFRARPGLMLAPAERKRIVMIDASALGQKLCPMFTPARAFVGWCHA